MVYESDFYTTRRYRTSPSLSTYTVSYQPSRQVRILPGIGKVHVVHTYDRIVPYVGHKRLTVVSPPPQIFRVRPSVLLREFDRISYKYRPSVSYSYVNSYLNSPSTVSIRYIRNPVEYRYYSYTPISYYHSIASRPSRLYYDILGYPRWSRYWYRYWYDIPSSRYLDYYTSDLLSYSRYWPSHYTRWSDYYSPSWYKTWYPSLSWSSWYKNWSPLSSSYSYWPSLTSSYSYPLSSYSLNKSLYWSPSSLSYNYWPSLTYRYRYYSSYNPYYSSFDYWPSTTYKYPALSWYSSDTLRYKYPTSSWTNWYPSLSYKYPLLSWYSHLSPYWSKYWTSYDSPYYTSSTYWQPSWSRYWRSQWNSYWSRWYDSVFTDETSRIRADAASVLKAIHQPVVRTPYSIMSYSTRYSEPIISTSSLSSDYIYKSYTSSPYAKTTYYTEPVKRFIGPSHLAAITYAGGKAYGRRPYAYVYEDPVQNDIQLLSYYINKFRSEKAQMARDGADEKVEDKKQAEISAA